MDLRNDLLSPMKTLLPSLFAAISFCLSANAQELTTEKHAMVISDGLSISAAFQDYRTNPDATANTVPDGARLQQFSTLLMEHIAYPSRGKAYGIAGKMYVTLGVDARGRVQALSFDQSLGADFEQAITTAVGQLPRAKIRHLALPLGGHLKFTLPVLFKE